MKISKFWSLMGAVAVGVSLAGCFGGGGSSTPTGSVRLVNATQTHSSLDFLVNGSVSTSSVSLDAVGAYGSAIPTGSALQINDSGSSVTLNSTSPTLASSAHYALVAYEYGGSVQSVLIGEDFTAPTAGANVRVYDAAPASGKLDVYITTSPVTSAAGLAASTPVGSFLTPSVPSVLSVNYGLGTYYVSVTGAGNPADIRLLSMPMTTSNAVVETVLLTPSTGGSLINGSLLVQQGAYSAFRNNNTRVRLAAAVSANATVAASTSQGGASVTLDAGSVSPAFDNYALVPAGSAVNVTVNGTSVAAPAGSLVAGSDMTLLVYGTPTSAAASLLTDDNRPPSDATQVKVRLINGITGNANNALTLRANSTAIGTSSVVPGTASTYSLVPGSLNAMNLSLYSSQAPGVYYTNSTNVLNANTVYTVLAAGDYAAPLLLIR